jgi:hypothetical protein
MEPLPLDWNQFVMDTKPIRERVARQNAALGIPSKPSVTLEEFREQLIAAGVRPEDNLLSCGIIAAREE